MRYSGRAHSWRAGATLGWRRGWLALLAVILAVVALAGGRLRSEAILPPAKPPTINPRLVVRAHAVRVAGTLGSFAVRGSLYPGLPGRNMVRIRVGGTGPPAPSSYLTLVVRMPGMPMIPVTATLPARGAEYSGLVPLPMFGSYTAHLTLVRGDVRRYGTAQLSVPLSLGQ